MAYKNTLQDYQQRVERRSSFDRSSSYTMVAALNTLSEEPGSFAAAGYTPRQVESMRVVTGSF